MVLTNEGSNQLADCAGFWFYDRLLGNKPAEYQAEALAQVRKAAAKDAAEGRRPVAPALPGPDSDYVGAYRSDITGTAEVGAAGGGAPSLSFNRPGTRFGLRTWSGDVFVMTAGEPALAQNLDAGTPLLVQFQRTANGVVDRVRLGDKGEIEMTRVASG